jgi:hydrogenase maturation factor
MAQDSGAHIRGAKTFHYVSSVQLDQVKLSPSIVNQSLIGDYASSGLCQDLSVVYASVARPCTH